MPQGQTRHLKSQLFSHTYMIACLLLRCSTDRFDALSGDRHFIQVLLFANHHAVSACTAQSSIGRLLASPPNTAQISSILLAASDASNIQCRAARRQSIPSDCDAGILWLLGFEEACSRRQAAVSPQLKYAPGMGH